jgi:hypothetical protein
MRQAIQVKTTTQGDKMEPASRLNYAKMYTVEHNVKVYNFGMVRAEFIPILIHQWDEVLGHEQQQTQAVTSGTQSYLPDSQAQKGYASQYDSPVLSRPSAPEPPPAPHIPVYVDFGEVNTDYTPPAGESRQLAVTKGDRLAILDWPYEGWARAYSAQARTTGLVPEQYLNLYASAVALYSYDPPEPQGFVAIRKDDDLRVIERAHAGWALIWNARTAAIGLAPENYISP